MTNANQMKKLITQPTPTTSNIFRISVLNFNCFGVGYFKK